MPPFCTYRPQEPEGVFLFTIHVPFTRMCEARDTANAISYEVLSSSWNSDVRIDSKPIFFSVIQTTQSYGMFYEGLPDGRDSLKI